MRGNLKYLWLKNKGVTLIELLIALIISSILIAALYRVFVSQQQTYTVQEQVTDMQQNARVGINRMMSEIRMAGFGNVSMVLPVAFIINGVTRTFNDVVNPNTPVGVPLTIVYAIRGGATITEIPVPVDPNKSEIKVSSIEDFDITDVTGNQNKKYISIGGVESHVISGVETSQKKITLTDKILYNHQIGTPVYGIRAISYQVVNDDGKFTLKRDENIGGGRQPLADNIESTQFEYSYADGMPLTPANIRMVKVTVRARTDMPDPKFKGGVGEAGDPNLDKGTYRIRQIASNVFLRNMGVSP